MRRIIAAAVIPAAALGAAPVAQAASMRMRAEHRFGAQAVKEYVKLHREQTELHGYKVVGRDVATYGMPAKRRGGKRLPSRQEWNTTLATLRRWHAPPPVHVTQPSPVRYTAPAYSAPTAASTSTSPGSGQYQSASNSTSSSSYSGSSGGGLPPESVIQAESGGSYTAVNPSSGAYGRYQIMPSTAAGLGCNLGSPAGQDACARKIMATQGPSAWAQTWGR